jgi:hypothetical protein
MPPCTRRAQGGSPSRIAGGRPPVRGRQSSPAGRHDMDHPVAAAFEFAEEVREHRRRLGLRVVQQHDAAAGGREPLEQQLALVGGRHPIPVACPEVGTEHDDGAPCKPVEQGGASGKARKAEKRCSRCTAGRSVEDEVDRLKASAGWATALRPRRKKVARTHSCRSAAKTRSVGPSHGPSSKVSTTSFGASGSVCGKCLRPSGGVRAGLIASTRAMPSASGRPGQSAAEAGHGVPTITSPSAASCKVRTMICCVSKVRTCL